MESYNLSHLELQLQNAVTNDAPNKFDFVAYTADNKSRFGIILDKLEYGEPLSVIVPFFEKSSDTMALLTNSENMVVRDAEISAVLNKDEGLRVWKEVIKETNSNPAIELEAKLNNFVPKIVADNYKNGSFSFKKTFDECVQQNQQLLSQVSANIPLERIFDKVMNEVISHSVKLGKNTKNTAATKLATVNAIHFQKLDMKNRLVSVLEEINSDNKTEDISFIDNFKQRFESNSITKEDVDQLLSRIDSISKGVRTSDIINDFVTQKKTEILNSKNLQIPLANLFNPIDDNSGLLSGEKIAIQTNGEYHYGTFLKVDSTEIVYKDHNETKSLPLEDLPSVYRLFESQQILERHLKEKFQERNILINWDDLSFENQLQLLKGQNTELLKGIDRTTSTETEFKLFAIGQGNTFDIEAKFKNQNTLDLHQYSFKGQKLSEQEIEKLQNNEVIVFEVFDKNGTLQYAHDMKYDRDLNDVVVNADKGENYAPNLKIGREQGYYAKTRIENKGGGSNTMPKL